MYNRGELLLCYSLVDDDVNDDDRRIWKSKGEETLVVVGLETITRLEAGPQPQ